MAKIRPPMSIAPKVLAMKGGLAGAHTESPFDAVKNDPAAAAALDAWSREPAERIAGSIGALTAPAAEDKPAEAAQAAPATPTEVVAPPAPVQAPVAPSVQDKDASASQDLDEELSEEEKRIYAKARYRNYTKRWNDEYAKLFAEHGKATPNHFRVDTELYAKVSVFRDDGNETWGDVINEALRLLVKKRERDIGYKP